MAAPRRAATLSGIVDVARPMPLRGDWLDAFYVDTSGARGEDVTTALGVYLRGASNPVRVLFAGHRGSGKSTELERLARRIEDRFWVVSFSAQDEVDLADVSVYDLMIAAMDHLQARAAAGGIQLPSALLEDIHGWLANTVVTRERARAWGAEAEAGGGVAALAALFAKVRAWVRTEGEERRTIRDELRRRFVELAERCNRLLKAVAGHPGLGGRLPLLVIEDLDKIYDIKDAEDLFLDQGQKLVALDAHMILTVPIGVWYSPRSPALTNVFDRAVVLPSIAVRTPEGEDEPGGLASVRAIVERRLEPGLVESAALDRIVRATGGMVRDVFRVLVSASVNAQVAGRPRIETADVERALRELTSFYERSLASRPGFPAVEQLYAKLGEVHERPFDVTGDDVLLMLLHGGQVLEYNGRRWLAPHPLVADILRRRGIIP